MSTATQPRVLWNRIFALAALNGTITFAWLAYILYLPKLLEQSGLPLIAVSVFLIVEGVLSAIVEPWMGSLSDDRQRRAASRYPLIAAGVLATCGLFVVLPLVVFANPGGLSQWLVPVLLIAWSLAMAVFRSPALALLSRYAAPSSVPLAAGVLSIASGLAGALGPFGRPWLLERGPLVVFGIASVVLLVSALVLGRLERNTGLSLPYGSIYISTRLVPKSVGRDADPDSGKLPLTVPRLALIFCTGVGASLGFRFLVEVFPKVLTPLGITPGPVMGALFLSFAALALPAGFLAVRVGNGRTMCAGLLTMALLVMLVPTCRDVGTAFALACALGAAHSLVLNGLYAYVLGIVPLERAGLGIGLYFGGGGVAMALAGALAPQLQSLGLFTGVLIGCAGFLVAALCLVLTGSVRSRASELATVNL
ncbi:MAG: MFS transporter [Gemmatimonadaceae bacterium]|nr:MFS transporter [Gloeobacterales cyanobacterium ES-bin-141]